EATLSRRVWRPRTKWRLTAPSGAAPLKLLAGRLALEDAGGSHRAFGRGPVEAGAARGPTAAHPQSHRAFGRGPVEARRCGRRATSSSHVSPRLRARPR